MAAKPSVFAVVLNFNRGEDTLACLRSLRQSDYPNLHLILVDNHSENGDWRGIPREIPNLTVIENEDNFGYAGGNNRGIRRAWESGADYVLVLNNDTTVDPAAVSRLVAAAERHPNAALVGPQIRFFDEPERIDSCGTRIHWLRLRPHLGLHGRFAPEAPADVRACQILPGSALLLPRAWRDRLGEAFDENLFLIHEDADLCLRVRALGGQNLLAPDALVYHKRSRTLSAYPFLSAYYTARNFLYLAARRGRFGERLACAIGLGPYLAAVALKRVAGDEAGRREASGMLAGVGDFFKGKTGPYRGRGAA